MHRGYMFRGHGGLFGGWFIPFILLILIGVALYMIFRNKKEDTQEINKVTKSSNHALDILDERYAKGEIDEKEYKKMKENLHKR